MKATQLSLPLNFIDEELFQERTRLVCSTRSKHTISGYACDWKDFSKWTEACSRRSLPASSETVALYITDMLRRERRISTCERHFSSILHHHRESGFPAPAGTEVRAILAGAQRLRGEHPRGKAPIGLLDLRKIVSAVAADDDKSVRDRAIILLGFATALRRSNIADLLLADLRFVAEGVTVHVRREKQDQQAKGRTIGVPLGKSPETCPVGALTKWLDRRGSAPGPVFTQVRNRRISMHGVRGELVSSVIKSAVQAIGLDPAQYAGHSLRAGFVTEALEAGVGELVVMTQTGHRSLSTLRRYFRPRDPFRRNACSAIGL